MTDFMKEKFIKSIIEADLIIAEINKKSWEEKITRVGIYLLFFSVCAFLIKFYFENEKLYKK